MATGQDFIRFLARQEAGINEQAESRNREKATMEMCLRCEKLREEVERIKKSRDELKAQLKMEREMRLEGESRYNAVTSRINSENDELKAALEKIRDGIDFGGWNLRTCFNIATEAIGKLNEKK